MKESVKHLSLRIDETLLKQFRCVAAYEGRSANSQLLIMIREAVRKFEIQHGEIESNASDSTP